MPQLSNRNATYVSAQWQIPVELQRLARFPAVLLNAPCADLMLHVLPVLPKIDERRSSAVRAAVQIDALVSEKLADIVEVVHRDVSCVETNVGVVPFETLAKSGERSLAPFSHLPQ